MRALIQRVTKGSVTVNGELISQIGPGYVILLGIFETDSETCLNKIVQKVVNLRIMDDEKGVMNKSILDTRGEILVVSQFTLCADTENGRRPSYIRAMEPEKAQAMYEVFVHELQKYKLQVQTGKFGTYMEVSLVNDGPVTILLEA